MKILVTGGAGFIGSHIVDKYIEEGHDVFVYDDLSTGNQEFVNPKASFIEGDILDIWKFNNLCLIEQFDVINHHAAKCSVRASFESSESFDVNLVGTMNVIKAAKISGTRQIIFASSSAVYGDHHFLDGSYMDGPRPIVEGTPCYPLSPYAVSKLASEHYLRVMCSSLGIKWLSFRYGNVYGPRQTPRSECGVIPLFTSKILNGEIPEIYGDGNNTRDYIHVDDVVAANVLALDSGASGEFNIGRETEWSTYEVFEIIADYLRMSFDCDFVNIPFKESEHVWLCIDSATRIFGWLPRINFEAGIISTIEWVKEYERTKKSH